MSRKSCPWLLYLAALGLGGVAREARTLERQGTVVAVSTVDRLGAAPPAQARRRADVDRAPASANVATLALAYLPDAPSSAAGRSPSWPGRSDHNGSASPLLSIYTLGSSGRLYERRWGSQGWAWLDTGRDAAAAPAVHVRGRPRGMDLAAVRIDAFVPGIDGRLWGRHWDGSTWSWRDTGMTASDTPVLMEQGDLSDVTAARLKLTAWVRGSDAILRGLHWDGRRWSVHNTGKAIVGRPVAHLRGDVGSPDTSRVRANLFANGVDGRLWEYYWDGTRWAWSDTQRP